MSTDLSGSKPIKDVEAYFSGVILARAGKGLTFGSDAVSQEGSGFTGSLVNIADVVREAEHR